MEWGDQRENLPGTEATLAGRLSAAAGWALALGSLQAAGVSSDLPTMKSFRQESGQHLSGPHLTSASWTYRKLPWRCSCCQEKAFTRTWCIERAPSVASWCHRALSPSSSGLHGIHFYSQAQRKCNVPLPDEPSHTCAENRHGRGARLHSWIVTAVRSFHRNGQDRMDCCIASFLPPVRPSPQR